MAHQTRAALHRRYRRLTLIIYLVAVIAITLATVDSTTDATLWIAHHRVSVRQLWYPVAPVLVLVSLLCRYRRKAILAELRNWPGRDRSGRIPLHYAACDPGADTADLVARLVAEGQDPNDRDHRGMTPLMGAVQYSGVAVARVLLEAGADPNAHDDQGDTPLHYAVNSAWTSADMLRLLREAGADPLHRNHRGSTPVDRVRMVDNKPLIKAVFADVLDQQWIPPARKCEGPPQTRRTD